MSQTTISAGGMAIGVAGQVADSKQTNDIISGFSQEAVNQIPFGYGLMKGPTPDGYVLPTGSANASGVANTMEVAGLSVFDLNHARAGVVDANGFYTGDLGASGLLPKSSLQVGRQGRFLVPVENTVQNGDRAFCRIVATGALTQGLWGGTALGGSYVRDCQAQGVFRSATFTAADGTTKVAVLECDFTNKPA